MKKKPLKLFFLLLISSLGLTTLTVLACGGGDWDETEGSMFTPEIINQPAFSTFFRTTVRPFYDGYDDAGKDVFRKLNCKEWATYFDNKTDTLTLEYWLYDASLNQVDSMIFALKDKPSNLSASSQKYNLKFLNASGKAVSFLYFLGFAKRNETFAVKEEDNYWDPKPVKKPATVFIEKQIIGGLNFFTKATDSFLKERYAFQLMRLYFFNRDYDKVISFYDENKNVFSPSRSITWRSLGYKGAALYKQKMFAASNVVYAQLYDQYEPLRKSAYLSFHPLKQAEWAQCLTLARSNNEKESLWLLFGLYTDHVNAMKELLKLNPKSTMAELLLVRSVNMEEEKFNHILTGNGETQKKAEASVDKDFVAFLNTMSADGKTANPVVWHLSAAYLNYIIKDYKLADEQLKRAQPLSKTNSLLNAQYRLISLAGKIRRIQKMTEATEKDLLPDLDVLFSKEIINNTTFRGNTIRYDVRNILSSLYHMQNEHEKAELIFPQEIKTHVQLLKMIAYLDKQNKTPFETFFTANALLKKQDYIVLLGVRYAQHDQLELAVSTLKSLPAYHVLLLGNPFTIHIKDCHDCDHQAKQKVKYTRGSFLEKMIEMKATALAKPAEAAQNYFLIGNGFYNMTEFGNARYFYENNVFNTIYDDGRKLLPEQTSDLALKYYLLAFAASTDKEFKAKCTFMAAKCEQNGWFMRANDDYKGDFKSGLYFAQLKKNYSGTKYYQDVINECGYFHTYIGN